MSACLFIVGLYHPELLYCIILVCMLFFFFRNRRGPVKGPVFKPSMDSFFKAAVCDLDKLLDDFELSSGKIVELTFSIYLDLF